MRIGETVDVLYRACTWISRPASLRGISKKKEISYCFLVSRYLSAEDEHLRAAAVKNYFNSLRRNRQFVEARERGECEILKMALREPSAKV